MINNIICKFKNCYFAYVSYFYSNIINKLKPNYFIHGDDWKTGIQANVRKQVIETLAKWQGELIEVPYNIKIQDIEVFLIKRLNENGYKF